MLAITGRGNLRHPEWSLDLPPRAPIRSTSIEDVFGGLLATWKDETVLSSSLTEIFLNPAHQAIIGLGLEAVPLLLRELAREPTHLGWALASITRENPVTEEIAGDVLAQAEAWLAWGRLRGYR
jgi:hypothetical protein